MKRRTKRFDEGGDVEVPEIGTGLQKETFKEAFKRARDRKAPDFEFNGKKFTTETKEEARARKLQAIPDESAAETARLRRQVDTTPKAAPKTTPKTRISSEDVSPPAGTKLSYESSRVSPRESRSAVKGGGGSGGGSGLRIEPMLGADLDPKRIVGSRTEPTYKRGGKVSSASSRGDGCAQRGKTKGRMV